MSDYCRGIEAKLHTIVDSVSMTEHWRHGVSHFTLMSFEHKTKPWVIKLRDHIIDVEGYGKSIRYPYQQTQEAVKTINACFESFK